MKFILKQIILWLENGTRRVLEFEPNKINIITGGSGTGKSSILEIIDYCLCSSEVDISDEDINENVKWYGINFHINGLYFTIARGKLVGGYKASTEYYFSGSGMIPDQPEPNISEKLLKGQIEKQFSINSDLVVPYGGKSIKAGSKISYRFLLPFTTQSDEVIISKSRFFDKLHLDRYKDGFERVFNIALMLSNPENVLRKEKVTTLLKTLNSLEKREELLKRHNSSFEKNILELFLEAQQRGLLESGLPTFAEAFEILKNIVGTYVHAYSSSSISDFNDLISQRRDIIRRIKNIQTFEKEYNEYKASIKANQDSLKPIELLRQKFSNVLLAPAIVELLDNLQIQFEQIKVEISKKNPIPASLDSELETLKEQLDELNLKINTFPTKNTLFDSEARKLMFIGEIKARLDFYNQLDEDISFSDKKEEINKEIEQLETSIEDDSKLATIKISLLHDFIESYIRKSKALGRYQEYKPIFDLRDKSFALRAPDSVHPASIGSSSNYLFMHICLFLGLHEYLINVESPYVPSFMIWDQLSRPYYEEVKSRKKEEDAEEINEDDFENDDRNKLIEGLKLLDYFIGHINKKYKKEFQFIVIEHVSTDFLEAAELKNYHLVANFRGGEALVPNS